MADVLGEKIAEMKAIGQGPVQTAAEGIGRTLFELKGVENLNLFPVGKPVGFPSQIDPKQRIRKHLMSKMNVVDLIPCDYMIPLSKAMEVVDKDSATQVTDAMLPHISYFDAVEQYAKACNVYGLGNTYGGVRLFLTDETTSTDDFSNSYADNWLQSSFNALTDMTRQMREIGRSTTSTFDKAAQQLTDNIAQRVGNLAQSDKAENLTASLGAALFTGNKISLPKLWSDSNYNPNVSAVVKLVSPYGHPKAIKQFIIRPLMHLLIMASARTPDGITYGQSPKMTIKGYGITHIPLGHISGVNLRKGGADTSYNIYRQPLSIDVSITFQSLVDGFAHFNDASKMKINVFDQSDELNTVSNNINAGSRALFQTLETVVDSLKPVVVSEVPEEHNSTALASAIGKNAPGDESIVGNDILKEPPSDFARQSKESFEIAKNEAVGRQSNESATDQANFIASSGQEATLKYGRGVEIES